MIYPNPYITGLIMVLVNFTFEYNTLTRRHGLAVHIVVRVATGCVLVLGRILVAHSGMGYGLPVFYLLGFLFFFDCAYLFEESLSQKLFLFFMNWGITTFLASLSVWLTALLAPWRQGGFLSSVFYIGSYCALAPFYVKYWRKPIRESLRLFEYGKPVYAFFPLLAFLLFTMFFGPRMPPLTLRSLSLMLLYETLVVFTYYLLFAHVKVVYDRRQSEADLKASERQKLLQKKYYEEMERGVYAQRRLLHDSRHHLMALGSLSSSRDYEALDQYLERLLKSDGRVATRCYCENHVANAVIGGYVEMALAKGITVDVDLDLPEGMAINEYDLCVFFGNTIENAIEACGRIPADSPLHGKRRIAVKSRLESDCLVVHMENSCQPDPSAPKDAFPSSKGELGGVGLESVRTIVNQYGGCLSCERQGGLFVLSALLYPRSKIGAPWQPPAKAAGKAAGRSAG